MNAYRLAMCLTGLMMSLLASTNAFSMYDPALGRFCSRDPIRVQKTNVSLLGYVGNSPLASSIPVVKLRLKSENLLVQDVVKLQFSGDSTTAAWMSGFWFRKSA